MPSLSFWYPCALGAVDLFLLRFFSSTSLPPLPFFDVTRSGNSVLPIHISASQNTSSGNNKPPVATTSVKKDVKKSLKGVVVKKKTKPPVKSASTGETEVKSTSGPKVPSDTTSDGGAKSTRPLRHEAADDTATERQLKRRRVSESDS